MSRAAWERGWAGLGHRARERVAAPNLGFSSPTALRFRLLKHTRLNVVAFLNELPKTQHDINSFVVDISAQTVSTCFFPTKAGTEGRGGYKARGTRALDGSLHGD